MITTTALTKSYKKVPAVHDVSLRCEPGTVTGFLGANGAGKSTTLKMIVGLARPDRGTATIDGRPIGVAKLTLLGDHEAWLHGLRVHPRFRRRGAARCGRAGTRRRR